MKILININSLKARHTLKISKSDRISNHGRSFFMVAANVTIIAAVADLKAQMFHFKTKVHE